MRRSLVFLLTVSMVLMLSATAIFADGTETLGAPSIAISSGSGIEAGGVGMVDQPGLVNLDVPASASVNQVLLYWNGFHSGPATGADNTISVNGTAVTGTLIGGPTLFFGSNHSSTYRADITSLSLVAPGANVLTLSDMSFDRVNNGAGVLVIFDDGSLSEIGLVDGNDLAFINFAPPLDTTVAQTFTFAPEPVNRVGDLSMFFSSVEGQDLAGERPTTILVTVGATETEYDNLLVSGDGDEWDTLEISVNIPAGEDSVTVQALSEDRLNSGNLPASFAWNAAALSVPVTPPDGGGEGCTPGYWKQPHHLDSWVGFAPGGDYATTFGVSPTFGPATLLEALELKGGQELALGRHSVAALLNSVNPDVSYEYTSAEVIALVQDAYASGDFNGVKAMLEAENELGCPLD